MIIEKQYMEFPKRTLSMKKSFRRENKKRTS